MPKTWPACTSAKVNLRDRVLGEVEKNGFIVLPDKEGHSGLMALRTMCPNQEGFGEEFYGAVQKIQIRPMLGRSPGEWNDYSFQYSCTENPMDRGAWWATVHGVAKSQTRLSD